MPSAPTTTPPLLREGDHLTHGRMDANLACWLGTYADYTLGCEAGSNATWVMGENDVPHWRERVTDRYREIQPDADGLLRSRVFPGLWLDPAALWDPRQSLRRR